MDLNLFVVVVAVLIGTVAAFVVLGNRRGASEVATLVRGFVVGAGLSVAALIATLVLFGRDLFAAAHLLYVIATVGVPLSAAIVLVRSAGARPAFRTVLLGLLLLAPIGVYATHIEPFWLRVDEVAVSVTSGGDSAVRIGVLSDVQSESVGEYEKSAVATLLSHEPDIILVPGDLWQMPRDEFPDVAHEFASLLTTLTAQVEHVFVVNGNTDNLDALDLVTAGTGARVLDNEVANVGVGDTSVRVFGVSFGADSEEFDSARREFIESASGQEPVRVVLAHQPDEVYRFETDDPIDLLVAGHTHGGQIAVPLFGPLVTLSSVPRSAAAGGLSEVAGHPMYVSTGVGRERGHAPQVRFWVRPSIGVLDLVGISVAADGA